MQTKIIRPKRTLTTVTSSQPTVAEWVATYMASLRQRDKSLRTLRTYQYVLDGYCRTFGERQVETITLSEVEAWVQRPRRSPVTNVTLRKDAVVVRGLHQWLGERGVNAHPLRTLQFGKLTRSTPRPVEDDVWRMVWESDLEPLDRVWLGLGYFAGLRRLEIIELRPHEVDLRAGEMCFARKGGFHANVEYAACYSYVRKHIPHLAGGDDWVALFNAHVSHRVGLGALYVWPDTLDGSEADCNRLNKRCAALTRNLGLPDGALTPHRLRHSCATNLLRCGVPIGIIQRQLAHSSMDITQRYLQMSGELARSLHETREE